MSKKLTLAQFIVRATLVHNDKYDYSLVMYVDYGTKIKIICPIHAIFEQTPRKHLCGSGCRFCANNVKKDISFIKEFAKQRACVCISDTYINAHALLSFICPRGHPFKMTWGNFQQGQICGSCYSENFFGAGNPNWKGGISLKPYCQIWSNKGYKTDIKNRDSNICQNPYCFKNGDFLNIHHIDYNKQNCHPSNLITLCNRCNTRANSDRDWHIEWYQAIMNKKFNYKY